MIPRGLAWWRGRADGAAWLDRLPQLVAECAERWGLRVDEPYSGAHLSFVAPVELAEGPRAVLKINVPGVWENDREADALRHWDGRGAVRLLAYDEERRALLLERCEPGTPLSSVGGDEADLVAVRVLRRLWRRAPDAHPFRALADEAGEWAANLSDEWERLGRPFERRLVDAAIAAVRDLAPSQGEAVLLHRDLHRGNVLRAEREAWLAVDPQPLVGEREYDAASLLRDRAADPGALRRRLDVLATELGLDRERIRRWGIVHALSWGMSAGARKVEPDMVERARALTAI